MSKKIILVLFGLVYLFSFRFVFADVFINEVKISPTEERFIKLHNKSDLSVDLTGWYLQRKTQTGSSFGSLVSKTYFENKKINANSYFLISRTTKENSDIVLGNLTLTESNTIQLKNSDGEVVDIICWGDVNCSGEKVANPSEGQSILRNESGLYLGEISVSNENSSNVSNNTTQNTTTNENNKNTTNDNLIKEKSKIKLEVSTKNIAFVGIPLTFSISVVSSNNEILSSGKYFLNFGDGSSKEIKINEAKNFTHTFFYEGEYNITLEYFSNIFSDKPDITNKIKIKVIPVDISISRVGDDKDFFIEITNNTSYDIDISMWSLIGNQKSFIFPKNTIIEAQEKIILSPKVTNFTILDKGKLILLSEQKEKIFEYNAITQPVSIDKDIKKVLSTKNTKTISKENFFTDKKMIQTIDDNQTNLVANVSNSGIILNNQNIYFYIVSLFVLIFFSSIFVYFIRKSKKDSSGIEDESENFEIIDE